MTATTRETLFEPAPSRDEVERAERWIATDHARGPWNREHCHGGPPSALLARACESVIDDRSPADVDWQLARLTIELMRPVPVGRALELRAEVERPGRKISLVAAQLVADGVEVARARALRIRTQEIPLPPHPRRPDDFTGRPGEGRLEESTWQVDGGDPIAFHRSSVEHRWVDGDWQPSGPCKVWVRLLVDVIPGESPSGVQRAVAAADFGNGVSAGIDAEHATFINPDLTVHLGRPPQGEWIGLASHSVYGTAELSSGAGFAESALHDEVGRVGRSVQSLILQA